MLDVQVTKNNCEQRTLGKNDSTKDKNFAIREELLNGVENKVATESEISNLNQESDVRTKNQEIKTSICFIEDEDKSSHSFAESDKPFFHPSENAIREKLSGDDEDATVNDIETFDRLIDEEFSPDVSKESYNWKDKTENKFVFCLRKSDRAIREILGIDDDDATANDFGMMSNSSSSDVSSVSSFSNSFSSKLCRCSEKELCLTCFNKYASEFATSIERTKNLPNELNTDQNTEIVPKEISSFEINDSLN